MPCPIGKKVFPHKEAFDKAWVQTKERNGNQYPGHTTPTLCHPGRCSFTANVFLLVQHKTQLIWQSPPFLMTRAAIKRKIYYSFEAENILSQLNALKLSDMIFSWIIKVDYILEIKVHGVDFCLKSNVNDKVINQNSGRTV